MHNIYHGARKQILKRLAVLLMSLLMVTSFASADEEENLLYDMSNIYDFKTLGGMDARLAPHGDDLMGDMIDKNTGGITFAHTDISIPGNSGLEVALRRKISQGHDGYTPLQQGFGDWELDLPIAHITYGVESNGIPPVFNDGCLNNLGTMDQELLVDTSSGSSTYIRPGVHTTGAVLNVPGKGLSGHPGSLTTPADPKSDWTSGVRTTEFEGQCATVAVAPNGTKYKFGRHVFRAADYLEVPLKFLPCSGCSYAYEQGILGRRSAVYLITEVEDVHGNWAHYDYTNDDRAELTKISNNNGREISLYYESYVPNSGNRNSRRVTHQPSKLNEVAGVIL